jgi:hypothetical protein
VASAGITGSLPAPAQRVFDTVLTTLTPFDRAPGHDGETHGPDGRDPRRQAPEPTDLETQGPVEEAGYAGDTDEEIPQPGAHPDPTGSAGADVPDDTDVPVPHGGRQPGTPPNPGGGTQPVHPAGSADEQEPNPGEDVEAPAEPEEEDESEEEDEPEEDEPEEDEPEEDEPDADDEPEEDDELEKDDR